MEEWQKQHILQNKYELITNTDCNESLLSLLETKGILSKQDIQSVERKGDRGGMIAMSTELYRIVETRVGGYAALMETFNATQQNGVYKILEQGFLDKED